jgi:hypothetical protein
MLHVEHQCHRVKGVGNLLMNTVYFWCHYVLRCSRLLRYPGPMPDPPTLQTSYYPYPYFIPSSPDLFTLISERFASRKHTPSVQSTSHVLCISPPYPPVSLSFLQFRTFSLLFSFLLLGLFKTSHIFFVFVLYNDIAAENTGRGFQELSHRISLLTGK